MKSPVRAAEDRCGRHGLRRGWGTKHYTAGESIGIAMPIEYSKLSVRY